MDWDGIKYIFQIPLSWYKKIHNMIFHAYGTNFLTVREGYYGGMEIGIDSDGFSDAVGQMGYGKVKSVDGHDPDEDGEVSFGLTGGKWLKSNAQGHIETTDDEPITLDDSQDGYLYNNGGTLEYKDDEYVTLDTTQTITGEKTFEEAIVLSDGNNAVASISEAASGITIQEPTKIFLDSNAVSFTNANNTGHINFDSRYGAMEIYTYSGRGGGGYIDFHTDGSTVDYNSRIIDTTNEFSLRAIEKPIYVYSYYNNVGGGIAVSSVNGVYKQQLIQEPDRLYSTGMDNQIASRGYCRLNFARATHTHGNISNDGKITATRGTTPTDYYVAVDSNGNLFREPTSGLSPDLSNYVTTSALNTALQGYATTTTVSNLTDVVTSINNSYQDASDVSSAISTALQDYVSTSDLNTTLQDYVTASDLQTELADYVTDEDLDGFVTSVDGITPVNGAVSFGLAGSKWMKTDSSGHLTTTNDEPITLSSQSSGYLYNNSGTAQYDTLTASKWVKTDSNGRLTTTNDKVVTIASNQTGQTTNITVVTGVTWSGTQLVVARKQLNFSNGVLTSTTNLTNTTIDTVAYSPT